MYNVAIYAKDATSKRGRKKVSPPNFRVNGDIPAVLKTVNEAVAKLTPEQIGSLSRVVIELDEPASGSFALDFGKRTASDVPPAQGKSEKK